MGRAQHYALYGNVAMQREYCIHCKQYAFVSDGKLACCGSATDFDSNRTKRITEAQDRRKGPDAEERKTILELQGNRCLYCEQLFGSTIVKRDRLIFLKVNWDHFVPFSYSQNNYAYNFVAACQICNGIKSNLMFKTLEEARVYIHAIREAKEIAETPSLPPAGESAQ